MRFSHRPRASPLKPQAFSMAREESDREDLLGEATALVERIELRIPAFAEPVVAGFREEGAASFYFGPDCVYQFNSAGELRRGFENGRLIAAGRGGLYRLTRERTATSHSLLRREFTPEETAEYLARARKHFEELAAALSAGEFTVIGQQPAEANVLQRVQRWVEALPAEIPIARSPGIASPKKK